jgi:hypothetical protein
MIVVGAIVCGAGGWLFYYQSGMTTAPEPEASNAQIFKEKAVQAVSANNFQNLVGRWIRPDGGYMLEIRNIDSRGRLEAAYFNPRPIHVSQARLIPENRDRPIFIELRDTGYPGATYNLAYLPKQDLLAGQYYQPTVGQSFEVVFVRANP